MRRPDEVKIRPERPGDDAAVAGVVEAAFASVVQVRLVAGIRASACFVPALSLVAEDSEGIVGHVMISTASLQHGATQRPIANLSPLAVTPAWQGRGIGSALVREVTRRADDRGEPLVVLEGDPGFYGRLGFESSVQYDIYITLPDWAPPEAAQMLRLCNYDPAFRGQVVYPTPFDDLPDH